MRAAGAAARNDHLGGGTAGELRALMNRKSLSAAEVETGGRDAPRKSSASHLSQMLAAEPRVARGRRGRE